MAVVGDDDQQRARLLADVDVDVAPGAIGIGVHDGVRDRLRDGDRDPVVIDRKANRELSDGTPCRADALGHGGQLKIDRRQVGDSSPLGGDEIDTVGAVPSADVNEIT